MERSGPEAPPRKKPPTSHPQEQGAEEAILDKFNRLHKEAYELTTIAMRLDQENKKEPAFKSYERALLLIDTAVQLSFQTTTGTLSDDEIGQVNDKTYKMRLTRKEILERISDLQNLPQTQSTSNSNNPSTSSTATAASTGTSDRDQLSNLPPPYSLTDPNVSPYQGLNSILSDLSIHQQNMMNPLPINGRELARIHQNVQMYFIGSNDTVSAPSYPTFLRIVVIDQVEEPQHSNQGFPAFLQVGEWTYPLIPGQSPMMKSPDGTYLFPDLNPNSLPGSSIGIIFPTEVTLEERETIEELLLELTGLPRLPQNDQEIEESLEMTPIPGAGIVPPAKRKTSTSMSHKIAEGLVSGAEAISKGLTKGAEKTTSMLNKGTNYLVKKIDPAQDPVQISGSTQKTAKQVQHISGKAVKLSSYILTQVGKATVSLGNHVAPHIHKQAVKIVSSQTKGDEAQTKQTVDNIYSVGSSALVGFSTVWMGLESSGKILARGLATNTVTIVEHRYGDEAGELAQSTTGAIGNTLMTGMNIQNLGPKSLAKRVAKDAGKAVLKNKSGDNKDTDNQDQQDPKLNKGPLV